MGIAPRMVYPDVIANSLTVYNGNLIEAGQAGLGATAGPYIAQLQGDFWNSTMDSLEGPQNSFLTALTEYKGNLIAGGKITYTGWRPVQGIAQWNGYGWDSIGPSGQLTGGIVISLGVYNNNLIVGGIFYTGLPHNFGIIQWDGNRWDSLGKGITISHNVPNGGVNSMIVYNGKLIAAGAFDSADGMPAKNIAQWDGTSWSPLGSGVDSIVTALTVYDGKLIVGGLIDSAGGIPVKDIAQWDGNSWSPLGSGISGYVYALTTYNGVVVAGGLFAKADGIPARNVAQWDGSAWDSIGDGINTSVGVCSFTTFDNILYAGGAGFTFKNKHQYYTVAKLDGPLGIYTQTHATVYPNPGYGRFTVIVTNLPGNTNSIELYNMLGQKVYTASLPEPVPNSFPPNTANNYQYSIDLSGQSSGMYIYHIIGNSNQLIASGKLVIE